MRKEAKTSEVDRWTSNGVGIKVTKKPSTAKQTSTNSKGKKK